MNNLRQLLPIAALALFVGGCPKPIADQDATPSTTDPAPGPVVAVETTPTPAPTTPIAPSPFAGPSGDEAVTDALDSAFGGDLESAKADLLPLLNDPEVGQYAAHNLGVIAFREGQQAQAIDYFEDALDSDPSFAAPLVAIVRIHLRDGDLSAARRAVDAATSRSNSDPSIRAAGLYITLHEGRHEQVIRDGRDLLLEDEENLDIFLTMATAYLETDRVELAEYIIGQALGRSNSRVEFTLLQARISLSNDDLVNAQSQLQRVLAVDPYNAEAHNNLGVVRNRLRNYSRAEESFDAATRYAPDYAEAWLNLGNARKGQQDYAGAQEAFERALQVKSDYGDAYYNLAVLYLDAELPELSREERLVQALAYFDQYLATNGNPAAGHAYHIYRNEAQTLLDTERDLQMQQSGDAFGDGGGFDDGGDDWGDDGGDDWGDDWGDDGGGDDWGDDGGDDDWGDDGGDDDWGDDGGDDDWGDDGGDDDWGDDGGDDDWGDDGGDDDWGDDGGDDDWGDDDWTDPEPESDEEDEESEDEDEDPWVTPTDDAEPSDEDPSDTDEWEDPW